MSILLLILKIIGILLLGVLGLLLLILLSVLFAPVRYRIRGSSDPEISVSAAVRWLFPLVSFQILFEGKALTQKLRILGIPIPLGGRKKTKKKGKKSVRTKDQPQGIEQEEYTDQSQEMEKEEHTEPSQDREQGEQTQYEPPASHMSQVEGRKRGAGRKPRRAGKIRALFHKVKSLPRMIKKKVAKLKEMVLRIWSEIKDEANRNVLVILIRELKYLSGHYLPGRIKAEVEFGMADPAATGQILGILSLFPVVFRPGVHIIPDFMTDKMYFTGSFEMRGHMRMIHLAASAFRLWREPDVKALIKRVQNSRR